MIVQASKPVIKPVITFPVRGNNHVLFENIEHRSEFRTNTYKKDGHWTIEATENNSGIAQFNWQWEAGATYAVSSLVYAVSPITRYHLKNQAESPLIFSEINPGGKTTYNNVIYTATNTGRLAVFLEGVNTGSRVDWLFLEINKIL